MLKILLENGLASCLDCGALANSLGEHEKRKVLRHLLELVPADQVRARLFSFVFWQLQLSWQSVP